MSETGQNRPNLSLPVALFLVLALPLHLYAEDSSPSKAEISLPYATVHVTYESNLLGLNPQLERLGVNSAQKGDLYIDAENNKIAYVLKQNKTGKISSRKVFDGVFWYSSTPQFSEKYLKEKAEIDPILELFSAHLCAPYPKIEKMILGKKSVGCEVKGQKSFFWNNILMERVGGSASLTATMMAKSVIVDQKFDNKLFEISQDLIANRKELEAEMKKSFSSAQKRLDSFFGPHQRMRIEALAVIDSVYQKVIDDHKDGNGKVDWDKVTEKVAGMDKEWAEPLGWDQSKYFSLGDFLREKSRQQDEKAEYYSELAKDSVGYGNEDFSKALKNVDLAIEKNPYNSQYYMQRAGINAKQSKYQQALQDYQTAIKYSSSVYSIERVLRNRKGVLCLLEQCDKALRDVGLLFEREQRKAKFQKEHMAKLAKRADAKLDSDLKWASGMLATNLFTQRADLNSRCGRYEQAINDYGKVIEMEDKLVSTKFMPKHHGQRNKALLLLKQAYLSGQIAKFEDGIKLVDEALAVIGSDKKNLILRKDAYLVRFFLHKKLGMREKMLEDLSLADKR